MRTLYLLSVWVHILAAMTWIGGMVVFVVALMPSLRRQGEPTRTLVLDDFGRRFRGVAWVCLAVLAVTGTFNLWVRGVAPADVLRPEWRASTFGALVLIKLTLVAAAIAVTSLHARAVALWQARWLGRLTLLVGLVIVGVAVLMVRAL